jgi:hypothetical protein
MVEQKAAELESQTAEQNPPGEINNEQKGEAHLSDPAAPEQRQDEEDSSTVKPAAPLCGVCNANPPKYKCPRCYMK